MKYLQVKIKKDREKSLGFRHPWVFSGAIESVEERVLNGDLVQVVGSDGKVFGVGYLNRKCDIALRMVEFGDVALGARALIERKLRVAIVAREGILRKNSACRLVYAEFDGLPGLVVDKFGEYLVMQVSTLGMVKLKGLVVELLMEIVKPKGILVKSEVGGRKREGLDDGKVEVVAGEIPKFVEILENGLKFKVDLIGGQKTGFFLDQRDNRERVRNLVKQMVEGGKKVRVLNLFSYSGSFGVYALSGGAESVVNVDVSSPALKLAGENVEINDLDSTKVENVKMDVFEFLEDCEVEGREFDLVR